MRLLFVCLSAAVMVAAPAGAASASALYCVITPAVSVSGQQVVWSVTVCVPGP
jgi:hypothetical protein